jgi:hypothetical protein
MARKKHGNEPQNDGGDADLIERESPGHDIGQAETESGHGPHITDVGVADDAAEDAQSAAALVGQTDRAAIKRANFSRLASRRVSGVLERLSVLENLANTNTYEWTLEQHDKIFNAIDEKLKEVEKAFEAAKKPKVRYRLQLRFEV